MSKLEGVPTKDEIWKMVEEKRKIAQEIAERRRKEKEDEEAVDEDAA